MTRYDRHSIRLAVALSAVAGFVDAFGFRSTSGFFVSFMSGNSTRAGIALFQGNWTYAAALLGVIVLFVLGVSGGTLAGGQGKGERVRVLALVSLLLAVAASFYSVGLRQVGTAAMVLAMGAENAVFRRDGEVSVGLTYMTGTLVKFGQRLAEAIRGKNVKEAVPYFGLWLGLLLGASIGAAAQSVYPRHGLWIAVLATVLLTTFARKIEA